MATLRSLSDFLRKCLFVLKVYFWTLKRERNGFNELQGLFGLGPTESQGRRSIFPGKTTKTMKRIREDHC